MDRREGREKGEEEEEGEEVGRKQTITEQSGGSWAYR